MGKALVPLLKKNNKVSVTTRSHRVNKDIEYIIGNAHSYEFIEKLLNSTQYDVVIDFMNYTYKEFEERVDLFLSKTSTYVFLSSARVYAPTNGVITEDTTRLLDKCDDKEYLKTNDYALVKARQEDLLINSVTNNWIIVRPGLTYNDNRMQFALWEKEEWLYRCLQGKRIIFPKDMYLIRTTMTYGEDVAMCIAKLLENDKSRGEIYHITSSEFNTWHEVYEVYRGAIKKETGNDIRIFDECNMEEIASQFNKYYQMKYARGINRTFDNKKLIDTIGPFEFTPLQQGIEKCINGFFNQNYDLSVEEWLREANIDRITGDGYSLADFHSMKAKIGYLLARKSKSINKILNNK